MQLLTRAAVVWLALLPLAAAEHHGQVKFGALPLPGASVTATQGDKKFVAVTDLQGVYSFPDLRDGTWNMQVEMLCFAPQRRDVEVGAAAAGPEWELKLLPVEEMHAEARAPGPALTVAPTAATSTAPPAKSRGRDKKAANTPANTSTAFQRTELNASRDAAKIENEGENSASPGEFRQNPAEGFLINGSVNNGAASPFAQAAAFGNNRRGGRSLYNGSIGMTFDNSALDARAFSLTGQDTPKPDYNRFVGMASFGGPLRIPHLWNLNNAPFVAINYQWMRNRNATTNSSLMPVAAERAGDFSQTLDPLGRPVHIFDPSTGATFAGNLIPQSRISPQARALLNFYPLPNFNSALYNYQIALVDIMHQDSLQTRFNKTLNRKNQLFGSFAFQNTRTAAPSAFGFLDTVRSGGFMSAINWSHRLQTRMFLTLGAQISRGSSRTTPYFAGRQNVASEAGITGNNQEPVNWGPPNLTFSSGIAPLLDAQPSFNRNQTASFNASVFWNRGSHNISLGGDYRRQQLNLLGQQNPRGTFTFTGAAAGSDFAGFLLGVPDTAGVAFGNADKYFRSSAYDLFFTDDWRMSPGFTLNAGMRWEYGSPLAELYGRLVNLDIAGGFAAVRPVVSANPLQPDKLGIEPRIGFAWHPILASSMVVRGGYGIYYDTSVYTQMAAQMAQQSPLSKSLSVQDTPANRLSLANGLNAPPANTPNTFAADPHFQVGYTQNWQLSMQQDLPGSLVMTATYLGIKGTRARQQFLPNTYPNGVLSPCLACPTGFAFLASNGNSTRESGQLQLRRRLHNGVTATLQYTFAKAIDNAALGGRGQGTPVIAQNWLDLSGERGLSNFDQRHLLSLMGQYSTGTGIGGGTLMSGWRGALFKDWTVTTNVTAGSGFPLTPVYLAAVRGTGVTGSIRPDYTGAPLYDAPPGLFLNPAAVAAPVPGQWGNAGRHSIIGPQHFTVNASLMRTFRIRDRVNADLRFDSTNALNHVTYPSWNTTVTSSQFGAPMAANAMRTMQVTTRLRF
jgi:hypothetical protein